jgi:hypothetical protein
MEFVIDALVVLGIVAGVALGVLYIYLADRMVTRR